MAAASTPTGLSERRARRVGMELAGVLVLVAIVVAYRRGPTAIAAIAAALGVFLLSLVAARSPLLLPIASRWMTVSTTISRVTAPAFLTIVYLVVFTPTGWIRRVFGRSPITRAPESTTYWVRRGTPTAEEARRSMERQF